MGTENFHDKQYDAGTLSKLQIFELYAQEWIPVFVSKPVPPFPAIHIFDFFAGPGTDSAGELGSPLRILRQLRSYYEKGMAGWQSVKITVHFFDEDRQKIEELRCRLVNPEWQIPGVEIDCRPLLFKDALNEHRAILQDSRTAKLLIIDQFGVDAVSDDIFRSLVRFPVSDFIFFLSSSTLHRFRDHPSIKQKIGRPEDSYHVHRAAVDYYRKLIPPKHAAFLGSFSIKKRSNIYGLIFGSQHPLGIHKFLTVAWNHDEIAGEANFNIERDEIHSNDDGLLPLDVMLPNKVRDFEQKLETALRSGMFPSEAELARFCIEAGMTCRHSARVLQQLKKAGVIELNFQVPNVQNLKSPRPIRMV